MSEKQEQESPTIHWRIDEWFPDLSPDLRASLKAYHEELVRFNRTLSLVSVKSLFVADALHFADSILGSRTIMSANSKIEKIYDFGSGPGFPGLVFGMLYPKVQVVLVEADQRRCEFLRHVIGVVKASNVSVENKTVESLPENSIQYAMARGYSNISRTILAARKPMVKGGAFYHFKGEEWGIEVGEIPTQLCSIWMPSLGGEYKLPIGAFKFSIVKTDKIA